MSQEERKSYLNKMGVKFQPADKAFFTDFRTVIYSNDSRFMRKHKGFLEIYGIKTSNSDEPISVHGLPAENTQSKIAKRKKRMAKIKDLRKMEK